MTSGNALPKPCRFVESNRHTVNAAQMQPRLIAWGKKHFRQFPWRFTRNPYRLLVAEIMLHRTQASQVVPVYNRFIEHYPDVASLAQAKKKDLREIAYPLGLRWRIDLINEMAIELEGRFHGRVPRRKSDLLSLRGVSVYIAGAVRCFGWNIPEPLIDTNTVRIVGRLFGLEQKESSRRNRVFRELITALVSPDEPRAYNYALLDLADQVCTKRQAPRCDECPLLPMCVYGASQRPS
jgi:A/G-specific adenine glycosylase